MRLPRPLYFIGRRRPAGLLVFAISERTARALFWRLIFFLSHLRA
jgi:hypothetical protein